MKKITIFMGLVGFGFLSTGCADKNTVMFVTNSSLGINFDSKPPTANIAYDRTEGFIGPRYPNGGAPPAVASIETGGSIFDPKVRQVYATGDAAVKATKGASAGDGPQTMEGDPNQRQLMFFGTETSIGLKVGFGTNGAPDSLLFGYRRKEASIIPLGERKVEETGANGQKIEKTVAVYPSVLASINMNVDAKTAATTGLTTKQFFATGQAAVALGTNEEIAAAFRAQAVRAARGDLTDDEIRAAKAAGSADAATAKDQLAKIVDYVTGVDGSLDKARLSQLVDDARKEHAANVPANLKNATSVGILRDWIAPLKLTISALFFAIPKKS